MRTDVTSKDVLGTDGTPLGLKNMSIYYDLETQEIHGMLSARNEEQDPTASFWRKYHNVAKVSVK